MPIYAYRCEACGFAKDVLQKMSEDPLTVCPECQQASFKKQVTAAGFQLKGSGWYVTDFRGNTPSSASSSSTAANSNSANNADGDVNSNNCNSNCTVNNGNSTNSNTCAANNTNDNKAA